MDAKSILYNCVYVVIMNRWGSSEGHHYLVGVFQKLEDAKAAAEEERQHRGGKYEWLIEAWSLNKDKRTCPMGKTFHRVARSDEMAELTDEESERLLQPEEPTQEWYDWCAKSDDKSLREELTKLKTDQGLYRKLVTKLSDEIKVLKANGSK